MFKQHTLQYKDKSCITPTLFTSRRSDTFQLLLFKFIVFKFVRTIEHYDTLITLHNQWTYIATLTAEIILLAEEKRGVLIKRCAINL